MIGADGLAIGEVLRMRRGSIDIPAATGAFAFASAVAVIHVSELAMRPPFAA